MMCENVYLCNLQNTCLDSAIMEQVVKISDIISCMGGMSMNEAILSLR